MISLLKKIFLDNWLRKLISFVLALIIWFVVDQSLTTTKSLTSVAIRIINLPEGKTVSGLQYSGLLNKRIGINFTGKRSHLDDLTSNDLEVVIDARQLDTEGVITVDKKHLVSLTPNLSISHHINRVSPKNLHINLVPLSTEKIPVYITRPIGDAPRGFQYLDIWPYHLNLTVSGPAETITKLKQQGIKLTYNLNEISRKDLEVQGLDKNKCVTSFYIPESWKFVNLPSISDLPIQIDDPDAGILRIDFIRSELIEIPVKIPITLVPIGIPGEQKVTQNSFIGNSKLISIIGGVRVLDKHLYTQGVSTLFLDVIKDSLYISLTPHLDSADSNLKLWSIQVANPRTLEDIYVNRMLTEIKDKEIEGLAPRHREEHLRNRFRNYLNRLQLYEADGKIFEFKVEYRGKELTIHEALEITPLSDN